MGAALELVVGFVTAPSTTFTAVTVGAGNSLTVRAGDPSQPIALVQAWSDNQADGTLRIRSPRLHDNVQGLRLDIETGLVEPLLPWGLPQLLYAQDQLTVELTGSATAGDIEQAAFLIYYAELPGVSGRFASFEEIQQRVRHIVTVENTLALGTAGGYSGEEALNAEFDLWKANTDYALLGYYVDTECAAVRWRGIDSGNLGLGGPGEPSLIHTTKDWFARLSKEYGRPMIPVFNSANVDGILVDGAQDENGTDVTLVSIFAELA